MTYTKEQIAFLDAAAIAAMQSTIIGLDRFKISPKEMKEHFNNIPRAAFTLAEALLAERTRRYESVKEVKG